jgi:voltage-gated potassium channel
VRSPSIIEKYRFMFLFIVMLLFFIFKAVSMEMNSRELASLVFILLIVYSLYVIGNQQRFLMIVLACAATGEIVLLFINEFIESDVLLPYKMLFAIIFFGLMTYACIIYMLKDKQITLTTLFGALCSYLFIGLSWSYIYQLIVVLQPTAFKGIDLSHANLDNEFIYYSFVTLTTLGYGDMTPVHSLAKTMSWLEAYTGQAFMTIVMAMLVGLYISGGEKL